MTADDADETTEAADAPDTGDPEATATAAEGRDAGDPEDPDPGTDDRLATAWAETVDDMQAMVEARQDAGWTALALAAEDVVPEHRAAGETDRFGLTFVVPGDTAARFTDLFRRGQYPRYEVYRTELDGRVFLVVEYLDPEDELAILAGGRYDLSDAVEMVHDAAEAGEMFTFYQSGDGSHLGTFRHDGHQKFVPRADEIDQVAAGE